MARIDYVDQRLRNWALWMVREGGVGGGYPSKVAFLSMRVDCDGSGGSRIPHDAADAERTNKAVESLRFAHHREWAVVMAEYVHGRGPKQSAQELCCAVSTVVAAMDRAHLRLSGIFREQAAELEVARARVFAAPMVVSAK